MDYDNCTIELRVGEHRRKVLIVSGNNRPTHLFSGFNTRSVAYPDMDAMEVYHLVKDAWYAIGTSILKSVIKPLNDVPTWGNILSFPGTSISLFADVWYVDMDSHAPDDGTYHEWHLRLNEPLNQIPGAIDVLGEGGGAWRFTEEFEALLVSKLYDYGFQYPSLNHGEYSPTGKMFVSTALKASQYGRRVQVINHWLRDV